MGLHEGYFGGVAIQGVYGGGELPAVGSDSVHAGPDDVYFFCHEGQAIDLGGGGEDADYDDAGLGLGGFYGVVDGVGLTAYGLDDHVGATVLRPVLPVVLAERGEAELSCGFDLLGVSGGNGYLGGAVPGEKACEEADGAGAKDQDSAFDLETAQGNASIGAGHRLDEGGQKRGKGVGDGVEGVGGDVNGLGEAAGFVDADEPHVGADVGGACGTVVAVQTRVKGLDGVEGVGEAGAAVDYRADDLVAHHHVAMPGTPACVDVEVGTADAAGAHVDPDSARGEGAGVDVFHDHALGSPF